MAFENDCFSLVFDSKVEDEWDLHEYLMPYFTKELSNQLASGMGLPFLIYFYHAFSFYFIL